METLYFNGDILTMKENAFGEPDYVQALLVREGKIAAAGSVNEVNAAVSGEAKRVDLKGRTLMPSFIDAHSHISMAMQFSDMADLSGCRNFEEIRQVLDHYRRERRVTPQSIILGCRYDHNFLDEQSHPDKTLLDAVSKDIPVYIFHTSGHMGVCNSALLDLAGIGADTPDPKGAKFGRLPGSLEPSGYVEETKAIQRILSSIYDRMKFDEKAQLKQVQDMYLSFGVTTVQDGASTEDIFRRLAGFSNDGLLNLDVVSYVLVQEKTDDVFAEMSAYTKDYVKHLKLGGEKMILDGSPQGKSAWLSKPYEGEKEYRGYGSLSDEEVYGYAKKAVDHGRQLLAHCNGDEASEQLLRAYEAAVKNSSNPEKEKLRPVMIHCQTVRKDQLERMARLAMIPSIFAAHTWYWGDVHLKNLGEQRGNAISPARTAFDLGLIVNFHQDTPVLKPDMLETIWCAVNRLTRSGQSIGSGEAVSVFEALKAVTINAAYAYFEENRKGTLTPGKLADLVILDANPLKADKSKIRNIRVLETIKEGSTLFRKEP